MNQTHFGPPSFNWGDSFHVKRRKEDFSSLFEHSVDKWMDGWGRRRKTILVAFILGTFVVFVIEMTTFNELVKSMNLCKKQSIFCRKCELIFLWQKTFFSHSVATPFFIIFWHERASIPRTNARRAKSWPQPKTKKLMVSCRRQVAALFCTRWRIIFYNSDDSTFANYVYLMWASNQKFWSKFLEIIHQRRCRRRLVARVAKSQTS